MIDAYKIGIFAVIGVVSVFVLVSIMGPSLEKAVPEEISRFGEMEYGGISSMVDDISSEISSLEKEIIETENKVLKYEIEKRNLLENFTTP